MSKAKTPKSPKTTCGMHPIQMPRWLWAHGKQGPQCEAAASPEGALLFKAATWAAWEGLVSGDASGYNVAALVNTSRVQA